MSEKFEKVKKYYNSGLWNEKMVRNAVEKKWITAEELEEITNEILINISNIELML